MENYKVGDLKRYGLDYDAIKAVNPGIIYCSVTGFGQTGPYAPRAGYDAILQAMGGLMSVTGHIDGEPGEGPMKVGPSIVDYMTGMGKQRELRSQWQRVAKLILAKEDVATVSRALELALFMDAKLDVSKVPAK